MAPPQGSVPWRQRRTCLRSTLRAWAKALQVRPLASLLDFTHFKRHKRGNLQVDGTERPGVPEYLGQLQTVKKLPAPAAGAAVPERWHPLLS